MNRSIRLLFALLTAAALFAAGMLSGLHLRPEANAIVQSAAGKEPGVLRFSPDAPQLAMLRISEAPLMPLPLAEPLNARIAYDDSHTARVSAPVAGRVVELLAQLGDTVAADTPLAVLDAPELGAAQADVAKARAEQHRRELALARAKELFAGDVLPRKDLESAEADFAQARAETNRAALRLGNLNPRGARVAGQRLLLASPVAGVVTERKANPGMEARPDLPDPLFVVTELRAVQVLVDMPEQHLAKITLRLPVAVEVDAYPGERFPGRIERIAPAVDPATRRVQVRCSVENVDRKLRPEMYARVTLLAGEDRNAVRVPNGALVTQGVQHFVFVEREPGVLVRRRVELEVQDRDYSYLAGGVAQGERIVTTGALLLASELAAGQ